MVWIVGVGPRSYGHGREFTDDLRTTRLLCEGGTSAGDSGTFPFVSGSYESSLCELFEDAGDAEDQCTGVSWRALDSSSSSNFGTTRAVACFTLGLGLGADAES